MFHYQFSSAPLSKGNPMEVIYQISDASIKQHLSSTLACQCLFTKENIKLKFRKVFDLPPKGSNKAHNL
jgi:hypothetical protein